MSEDTQPDGAQPVTLPDGDYAVVEIMGHRTRWGRVEEVERFGAKFLRVHSTDPDGEPLVEDYAGSAVFSVRQVPRVAVEAHEARQARRREQEQAWRETARSRYLPAPGDILPAPGDWDNDDAGLDADDRITVTEEGLAALRGQADGETDDSRNTDGPGAGAAQD